VPAKKGSTAVYLSSKVVEAVEKKMAAVEWNFGMTKFCETALLDYAAGKLVSADEVATEKLFLTMFGLGLIDQKRLDAILSLVQSGALPKQIRSDKLGLKIESVRGPKKKK
jgi:nitrate reductase NapAB chaperone NapD